MTEYGFTEAERHHQRGGAASPRIGQTRRRSAPDLSDAESPPAFQARPSSQRLRPNPRACTAR